MIPMLPDLLKKLLSWSKFTAKSCCGHGAKREFFYTRPLSTGGNNIFCSENFLPKLEQKMGKPSAPKKRALESYVAQIHSLSTEFV